MFKYLFVLVISFNTLVNNFLFSQEIKTDLNSIDILNSEWDKNILMRFQFWGVGSREFNVGTMTDKEVEDLFQ